MGSPHPESWYEPGKKYNRLTIINEIPMEERTQKRRELLCICDCGNIVKVKASSLFAGNTKSCGCLWRESIRDRAQYDIVGKRFGRLIAKEKIMRNSAIYFRCKCDCGNETVTSVYYLLKGNTKSCGCLHKETIKRIIEEKTEDITGQVFGELTAIKKVESHIEPGGGTATRWLFKCSCGKEIIAYKANVKRGMINNCGHMGGSQAEYRINKWLDEHNIHHKKQATFDDLRNKNTDRKLKFDYKLFRNDGSFFLIEHQGEQHFKKFKTGFGDTQREITDKLKKDYCQTHGITLYETFYNEDYIARLEGIIEYEIDREGDIYEGEVMTG